MPCVFAIMDSRIAWTPAHAVEMEEVSTHWWIVNLTTLKYFGDVMNDGEGYTFVQRWGGVVVAVGVETGALRTTRFRNYSVRVSNHGTRTHV